MSKMKYTQGHWFPFQDMSGHNTVCTDEYCLANVKSQFLAPEELQANTILMAASPKMLEALKLCFESYQKPDDINLRIRAIAQCNAAIIIAEPPGDL